MRRLPDDELLAAADEWRARNPRPAPVGDDGGPGWQAWRDQYDALLSEHGVTFEELSTLRWRRDLGRLRWVAEAEGREWGGNPNVEPWPPDPPDLTLWRCPDCARTTVPFEGHATVCVPCGRARAGIFIALDEPYRRNSGGLIGG